MPAVEREEPRWAEQFHWEEGGRVLVLDGGMRVVHGAPSQDEVSVGEAAQLATWLVRPQKRNASIRFSLDGFFGQRRCTVRRAMMSR